MLPQTIALLDLIKQQCIGIQFLNLTMQYQNSSRKAVKAQYQNSSRKAVKAINCFVFGSELTCSPFFPLENISQHHIEGPQCLLGVLVKTHTVSKLITT